MNAKTIYDSIIEFNNNDPITMKSALGSGAKYFPYTVVDGNMLFCLSKFCQFENATLPSYISVLRKGLLNPVKGGNKVKDEIQRSVNTKWVSYMDATNDLKNAFQTWLELFYPTYNVVNANFINITGESKQSRRSRRKQTYDEFNLALDHRKSIGELGEIIALEYEKRRLEGIGCLKPKDFIKHESREDQGAGYDIISNYNNKIRLIEVKATTGDVNTFYISSNELNVLASSPNEAYIYLVKITDISSGQGEVVREISDPINAIQSKEAILFKAKL